MIAAIVLVVLKAAAIFVLLRVALSDFREQKIRNEQIGQLLALSVAVLVTDYLITGDLLGAELAVLTAFVLFIILIGFWLAGKVGAGDVKLLATLPLLLGISASLPFMAALLVFSLTIFILSKYPMMLPESWFRAYLTAIGQTGRVPFGIPIAAAAIIALLLPPGALSIYRQPAQPIDLHQHCANGQATAGIGSEQFPAWMAQSFCK